MNVDSKHDKALNAIEDVEMLSLRWADVDGSLNREELLKVVTKKIGIDNAEEIIENLIDMALIHAFDVPNGGERYRTRFAETMRLLVRTRQIFRGESWLGAPPLVADFQVDMRPRIYPIRDRDSEDVISKLLHLNQLQREVWRAIAPSKLSRFQEEATASILGQINEDHGTIVTAGTGSGKTLAFYLPVILRIVELAKSGKFWTKAISIYPRKELLKDQLTETYRILRQANVVLNRPGYRPLRVGAYFGDTPTSISEQNLPKVWRRDSSSDSLVCPFLRCDCDGDLILTKDDLTQGRERLVCASECGHHFDDQILPLTRQSIQQNPPDILFTTTEMLNRLLSDQNNRQLFGIGQKNNRRPEFLLLDEAHTYSGVAGAQAALTLRRWRALAGGPVRWIGLSATLERAPEFFADLTGLPLHKVTELTPAERDMVHEGREYQVVLRGDPASRTSLLSTSIQASMLLARVLDSSDRPSQGRIGSRLFAFTDDLDVTHRLFDDLRDAEGYNAFGKYQATRGTLAALRESSRNDAKLRERESAGQVWRLPEEIGHNLRDPLVVTRTTSRDPGVNRTANVIVATSALEVGFNDPNVGAILQHKAPRNFASFLQRRGRAGRKREMRPMTVTVLSDYGRDRQLFQSFEHLFNPNLTAQSLPIWNQYVLRMQAVFALLDWIASLPLPSGTNKAYVWRTVSAPKQNRNKDYDFRKHLETQLSLLVKGSENEIFSLTNHLKSALKIDEETVKRILWGPPRSILLEVVPTLLRRVHRDWKLSRLPVSNSKSKHERFKLDHPLPEFAPQTLFSDLNLPEVAVILPPATSKEEEVKESLPILQALIQFAPGRVSRRFGDFYGGLAHWIPVPPNLTRYELSIEDFAEIYEFVDHFVGEVDTGSVDLPVYRPWRIKLEKAKPGTVSSTSNAFLNWASGFANVGDHISIPLPPRTPWCGIVQDLRIFLHQFNSGVSVRRFATGAQSQIRRPRGEEQIVDVRFIDKSGQPAAVGYEFETDGLASKLSLTSQRELSSLTFEPVLERTLSSILFKQLCAEDPELPREMNKFQREWVRVIFLLTAAKRCIDTRQSLIASAEELVSESGVNRFNEIIDALLGIQQLHLEFNYDEGDSELKGDSTKDGRHKHRLENLKKNLQTRLADKSVIERMFHALQTSMRKEGSTRANFLRRTLESTMTDALMAAVVASAPHHLTTESLVADTVHNPENLNELTVWITETTVGGAGVLQALSVQYSREPRSLFLALEAALEPTDLESASEALRQTYELMSSDEEVQRLVDAVRNAVSHETRANKRKKLLEQLNKKGIEVTRSFIVSLNSRILTPGALKLHDNTVRVLIEFWDTVENELGLELDQREIAVLGSFNQTLSESGTTAGLFETNSMPDERTRVFSGLLWPRTDALRRESLAIWTPFRKLTTPIPQLIQAVFLESEIVTVSVKKDGWKETLIRALSNDGIARLEAPTMMQRNLKRAILELQASPVTVGHLQLYPALERISSGTIRNEGKKLTAQFVLKEQV